MLDNRSLPPMFELRCEHTWRVFHLWLRFITFWGRSAHLAYQVHKSGRKTPIIIIIHWENAIVLRFLLPRSMIYVREKRIIPSEHEQRSCVTTLVSGVSELLDQKHLKPLLHALTDIKHLSTNSTKQTFMLDFFLVIYSVISVEKK